MKHTILARLMAVGIALAPVAATLTWLDEGTALAAGSARLKSSEVQEVSGAWHVFVALELPRAPPIPHVPMRFVFTKTAAFERSLVDNSKEPVLNRQALVNQTPTSESLDVDFANTQGKIFNKTNFDFGLTRVRGYEAGEYKLQIRTADGVDIGGPMNLTLKGDNPVVDRRSMTFEAKKKGVTKVDDGTEKKDKPPKQAEDEAPLPSNEVKPSGTAAPFIPADAYNPTEEEQIKQKPGGCGCTVPGQSLPAAPLAGLAAAALITGALSRRRRRA